MVCFVSFRLEAEISRDRELINTFTIFLVHISLYSECSILNSYFRALRFTENQIGTGNFFKCHIFTGFAFSSTTQRGIRVYSDEVTCLEFIQIRDFVFLSQFFRIIGRKICTTRNIVTISIVKCTCCHLESLQALTKQTACDIFYTERDSSTVVVELIKSFCVFYYFSWGSKG